jgi:hypothetical protein
MQYALAPSNRGLNGNFPSHRGNIGRFRLDALFRARQRRPADDRASIGGANSVVIYATGAVVGDALAPSKVRSVDVRPTSLESRRGVSTTRYLQLAEESGRGPEDR